MHEDENIHSLFSRMIVITQMSTYGYAIVDKIVVKKFYDP